MNRHLRALWRAMLWLLIFAVPSQAQHEGHGGAPPATNGTSGVQAMAGPYRVTLRSDPPVVPVGKATLLLKITDAAGQPIEGAQVRVLAKMPAMNMGEVEQSATPDSREAGLYRVPAAFAMAGGYDVKISISAAAGQATATIALQTGQNTATAQKRFSWPIIVGALVLLGLALLIWRGRREGTFNVRAALNRQTIGGVALLLLMLAIAVYAVRNFRRPGAMTPIEAQAMQMELPAPPGVLAVQLVEVETGEVRSSVQYTGQAAGFAEQDVVTRVAGNLLWMPLYAGDSVKRGQLLARLDTSQYDPQVAERRAMVGQAQQQADIARVEYQQALSGVNQARSEIGSKRGALDDARGQDEKSAAEIRARQNMAQDVSSQAVRARSEITRRRAALDEARHDEAKAKSEALTKAGALEDARAGERKAKAASQEAQTALRGAKGALDEAQSDVTAAREEKSNAEADVAAAQTQTADAQAQVEAAQADVDYWKNEIARMTALLKEGAVSKEEFQREQAQAAQAAAKLRQAQARVNQVQAEIRGAESRVRKADAMIASATAKATQAQAAIEGSQSRIEQAQADIAGATARVAQMQADVEAAQSEIKSAGSRVQQARAEIKGAEAEAGGALARVRASQADVDAARAEAKAAAARVRQSEADVSSAQAAARSSEAAARAMQGRIAASQSGVRQAVASLTSATTTRGYTEIRALVDGVVTQRLIAPGTLVQPGQAILKVAQINPIRLQANVAEDDLSAVRVGAGVTVRSGKSTIQARVTSVTPAVDPTARTGTVEAIVANPQKRLLPGQFVEMEIFTGQKFNTVRVPSRAVRQRTPPSGQVLSTQPQHLVWLAEPASDGQFTVRATPVRVGLASDDKTEVLSGLKPGQKIVVAGYQFLKDGDTVAAGPTNGLPGPAKASEHQHGAMPESSAQRSSIAITEKGFEPAQIEVKRGQLARVSFTRKTDATCATEVVFPSLNIKKSLPLNQPVTIEFTPRKAETPFACGMKMFKGKVVAQ